MQHLPALALDRAFYGVKVVQEKVKIGVSVNQCQEESIALKELCVPDIRKTSHTKHIVN
jgi:hypothetical protein